MGLPAPTKMRKSPLQTRMHRLAPRRMVLLPVMYVSLDGPYMSRSLCLLLDMTRCTQWLFAVLAVILAAFMLLWIAANNAHGDEMSPSAY